MFSALLLATPFFGLPLLFIAIGLVAILLMHELGHAFLASRLGYEVERIEISPIHGLCHYDEPYSEYEDSVIAWGGVAGQLLLFVPAATFLFVFGNTALGSLNVLLVVLAYINAILIVVNLAPGFGLDGTKAWRIVPIWVKAKWAVHQLRRKKFLK